VCPGGLWSLYVVRVSVFEAKYLGNYTEDGRLVTIESLQSGGGSESINDVTDDVKGSDDVIATDGVPRGRAQPTSHFSKYVSK